MQFFFGLFRLCGMGYVARPWQSLYRKGRLAVATGLKERAPFGSLLVL